MEKLTSILFYVKSINRRLKNLEGKYSPNVETEHSNSFCSLLPLNNKEECISFDDKIKEDYQTESFIKFTSGIGGNNLKDNIHRCLKVLFTDKFASECSWLGLRGNFKVSNLSTIKSLINLMKTTYSCTDNDVESIIKEWFRLAKVRYPRK